MLENMLENMLESFVDFDILSIVLCNIDLRFS